MRDGEIEEPPVLSDGLEVEGVMHPCAHLLAVHPAGTEEDVEVFRRCWLADSQRLGDLGDRQRRFLVRAEHFDHLHACGKAEGGLEFAGPFHEPA